MNGQSKSYFSRFPEDIHPEQQEQETSSALTEEEKTQPSPSETGDLPKVEVQTKNEQQPDASNTPEINEILPPILSLQNVSVHFAGAPVLRNIQFDVQERETVAVIGESGCGKTVLLKTLIALHRPVQGQIIFDGFDLHQLNYFDLAKIRTRYGFVFQQAALFDSMTIGENIAFPLVQHSQKSVEEIESIVVRLIREVGLPKTTLNKKPSELSGGMKKRVGFARALALEPELMLYDEPTTGLDPIMSDVINELMISTRNHHSVTSIIVTHDMTSACKVADRIIMLYPIARLKEGENQVIFDGTPEQLKLSDDRRVHQFVHGLAGDRIAELQEEKE